ncbi:MAG: DedA family protein [Alphaproteobacteria bacterium]|nr:DedA family protein [Alphaproteobacteria bacterium]
MIAFIQAHAIWVVPAALILSFLKSLAFVSLVVPSSLVVALIVALMGTSHESVWPVWVAVSIGAGLGDWVSYTLGDRLKERAHHMWPFTRRPELIPRGERFFYRWGALSVVFCRFFSPLRATVPLLCGIFEMPWLTFQVANWISAFIWAGVVLLIGEGVLHVFG